MDYRALDIKRLQWSASTHKVSYGGAGKFQFQTPKFTASLQPLARFPGAVEITNIVCTDPTFAAFLEALQQSAATAMSLDIRAAYPAFDKITAFSNTLFFDGKGNFLDAMEEQPPGAYEAAALLQLDGVWIGTTNNCRWSLKYKVMQMKMYGPKKRSPCFLDDEPV